MLTMCSLLRTWALTVMACVLFGPFHPILADLSVAISAGRGNYFCMAGSNCWGTAFPDAPIEDVPPSVLVDGNPQVGCVTYLPQSATNFDASEEGCTSACPNPDVVRQLGRCSAVVNLNVTCPSGTILWIGAAGSAISSTPATGTVQISSSVFGSVVLAVFAEDTTSCAGDVFTGPFRCTTPGFSPVCDGGRLLGVDQVEVVQATESPTEKPTKAPSEQPTGTSAGTMPASAYGIAVGVLTVLSLCFV